MSPTPKGDRLRARLNRPAPVDPDAPAPPKLGPVDVPDKTPTETPAAEPTEPEPARTAPQPARRRAGAAKTAAPKLNALEDPDCIPGEKDYRSFYVEDSAYFRFRAAIHWTSRNPDADDDVPENMTAAIEDYMITVAADLEQRFNGGEPFRMPPATKRRGRSARRRRNTSP